MMFVDDVWMIRTQDTQAKPWIRSLRQFWQACVHRMQSLISSLVYVDFMFQTSFILILEHIRHQITQSFSQVFKNASFLNLNYVS